MGFRGRRNAAGASSRPWHGRNRASSWPDPAAMCMTARRQKKPPDASREPEEPNASSRLAGAQGGVLDADRASPAFAQRSAINRRPVRGRALGAARQKRPPCRQRECAARRGAAARRRGLSSAQLKDAASTIRQYLRRHATRSHQRQGALQGDRPEQGRATEKPTS